MLRVVADILRRRRSDGWLVGGSVRDLELGRFSPDLDIVVQDDPRAVARDIARELQAPWFVLSERFPAYRVMGAGGHIDVAAARGQGILDDLAERDFTANAMAIPLEGAVMSCRTGVVDTATLVDPFSGLEDLRRGRLVAVSERVFTDDPLRMLRAVRFAHVLGLAVDEQLAGSIQAHAPLLSTSAPERVVTEMCLTLAQGGTVKAVGLWHGLGLLGVALPEAALPDRLAPALALLEQLDQLLTRPEAWFPESIGPLGERLARPVDGVLGRPVALRLAGLLHRLPPAEAERVGRRLKLSGEMLSLLLAATRCLSDAGPEWTVPAPVSSGGPGRNAVLFLWATSPWEPEVILLSAARPSDGNLDAPRRLLRLWAEREAKPPGSPLNGDDLMRELGLPGGRLLGSLLRDVRLAWEAGEVNTPAQALEMARSLLQSRA